MTWEEADIGDSGRVAVAEIAGLLMVGDQRLEGAEALDDPVVVPALDRLLVLAELLAEIAQHPQIVDRVDVAGDDLRQSADAGAVAGMARQQRRLAVRLVEILDDRQRLDESLVLVD